MKQTNLINPAFFIGFMLATLLIALPIIQKQAILVDVTTFKQQEYQWD
ncbi:hypothetical protein [Okeania sp. SIO1F9]|nr:hypothetical protein [Okeania sp. SIO1F9]